MNHKKFAIITVEFADKLEEPILQEIENKLRQSNNLNNFSPNSSKLSFSIWSENEIDYTIVNELKTMLKDRKPNLKIHAIEYIATSRKEF